MNVLKPKQRGSDDYEKIKKEHIDNWVNAEIEDINHEPEHEFKGKFAKIGPAVRFKFKLEGYQYAHFSRWMAFSYHEKSQLFKTYLENLVDGAYPDFDFDLMKLKGMKLRLMYSETTNAGKTYQNITLVRTQNPLKFEGAAIEPLPEIQLEDESPF